MKTRRTRVAVLFGGRSEEHDVSVKSATEIAEHIDIEKYEPIYIGVTKAGAWKMCEKPRADWESGECRAAILSPDARTRGLLVFDGDGCEAFRVDVVFPALHGRMGEDGAIQGLIELSGIPYVGCDIQSSAICMDKSLTYVVAGSAGIATPEFYIFTDGVVPEPDAFIYPVFVKPARSGSSFGVTRAENGDELRAAVETARRYDDKVIIERAVMGCEVGCAVMGNGGELFTGEPDQITLSHGFFRVHQEAAPEKGSENAVVTVPAELNAKERERIRETAVRVYRALGCRGLARVDMFRCDDGQIVLNEVNTMPGFTSYSRYPRMMKAAGVTLTELIDRLLTLAAEG
ncbi:MAG: D-alanine--(R)-lactate ligase [Oscillospiraceae bacterium]|jgi:D-alanine--(R)-lactate ligase|nr:D-alanine--(R)-lactate ligase [Oscillospiraceae bacterium]